MIVVPLIIQTVRALLGPVWGLLLMCMGYVVFDWITPFNTAKELQKGNVAVGMVICGILLGVALCVGLPLGFALF
jgi:putative membrane protein